MATLANVAIQDGQATPVTHTFYPVKNNNDVVVFRENQAGLPVFGQATITMDFSKCGNQKSGVNIVKTILDIPVLETATAANSAGYTAAPKVAFSDRHVIYSYLPDRGTVAQRKDSRVMASNLLKDAQFVDMIDNLLAPV